MAFDANLVLVDGSVDLTPATDTAPTSTTRSGTTGAAVIDLGTTTQPRGDSEGIKHMTAVLVLPSAPTTYGDYLTAYIEQSDYYSYGFERIASFPVLYAYTRLLSVTVVTAFAAADIGTVLLGGTTGDQAEIRWMHPDLLTVGKTGYMIVTMQAADDLFDDVDEAVDATAGTGDGTMNGAAVVETHPRLGGPNVFVRSFGITKRYVRGNLTVEAGGDFGNVELLLSPYPFKKL